MDRRSAIKRISMAMGYTIASPTLIDILSSCTSRHKPKYEYLSKSEVYILNHIIDIIIPVSFGSHKTTDHFLTMFADKMLINVSTTEEQILFRKGCEIFAEKFEVMYGKKATFGTVKEYTYLLETYLKIHPEDEKAILDLVERKEDEIQSDQRDLYCVYKFILLTKKHSLLGYFTSEDIMIH